MAAAHHRGLCGRNDRPLCDPQASRADGAKPHSRRRALFLAGLLALAAPATAQQTEPAKPTQRILALAAGWKALFLCSGSFVAGLDEATITATDLQGAYPELQPHLAALPAEIKRDHMQVSVTFDPLLPPRVAVRTDRGCTQLPIGMAPDAAGKVTTPARLAGASVLDAASLAAADARPWPLGDRGAEARHPRKAGLDERVAAAFAGQYAARGLTSAVLVVKDGRIIAERYRDGFTRHTPQRTWSVAKSLTSALIGRAQALGLVDVTQPPLPGGPDPDARRGISIDQYLRMQSGLWTNGSGARTDALYFGGSTVRETALTAPLEVAPGTRFNYANNDSLLAALAVEDRLLKEKRGVAGGNGFALDELLLPLGMTRTTIEQDWQGDAVLSSQVWMTARDMARLALLHLNDGVAGDVRLLPEGWVKDATTPNGPQPGGESRLGYGRAIWLAGPRVGLPEGSYAFIGNRGQVAVIVPSERLVVVRRGFDPAGVNFDGFGLARDIITALKPS